jgi:hypothetical protein
VTFKNVKFKRLQFKPRGPIKLPEPAQLRNAAHMFSVALLRSLHQAGWPALLAGVLTIASLAVVFSATRPMHDDIIAVEQQRKQLRIASHNQTAQPPSPQARLREFYAAFPARSALPEALMTLHRAATHNNLRDTRADYRDTPEPGTPLVRVRIDIPVSGSYTSIHNWIGELLVALPSLTLEGLELHRNGIGNANLEARARFQLLLRGAP